LICEELAKGHSLRSICEREDMPARSTVFLWLQEHKAFLDQYARAREAQADYWAEQIIEISDTPLDGQKTEVSETGTKTVTEDMLGHRRLQVDTRKWLMARLAPKKYGDKITQEVTGADGAPLVPIINISGRP
jgi:hypothetical protein